MELRLRRPRCHAEHLGDLFVLVAFYIMQDENASSTGRKPFNRLLEVEEIAWCQRHSNHAWQRIHPTAFLIVLFEPSALPSITLSRVEHEVHGEPMQPRRKRALAAKQVQLFPRPNKDVLRQLLGAFTVGDHSCAEREHSIDVLPV